MIEVAKAIGFMGQVDASSQTTQGVELLDEMGSYMPLTESFSTLLKDDTEKYFEASLAVGPNHPSEAGVVSADYATYEQDNAKMTERTGNMDSMIQNQKTALRYAGNSMTTVYTLAEPLTSVEATSVHLIMG